MSGPRNSTCPNPRSVSTAGKQLEDDWCSSSRRGCLRVLTRRLATSGIHRDPPRRRRLPRQPAPARWSARRPPGPDRLPLHPRPTGSLSATTHDGLPESTPDLCPSLGGALLPPAPRLGRSGFCRRSPRRGRPLPDRVHDNGCAAKPVPTSRTVTKLRFSTQFAATPSRAVQMLGRPRARGNAREVICARAVGSASCQFERMSGTADTPDKRDRGS